MKVIYATDMDRTLIFSNKFLDEYKPSCEYDVAEEKDNRQISYIAKTVKSKFRELNSNKKVIVVPVSTRSIEEFNRINVGVKTRFAIVDNGGTILEYGKPLEEWEKYISDNTNKVEMLSIGFDLEDFESIGRPSKLIDNKYVFNKIREGHEKEFDNEVASLIAKYSSNFNIVRQKNKVYAIPKCFTKAVALRWLQNRLKAEKIVASGDSELDLPMLAIADCAVVPEHGDLVKCGYVTGGRIANSGIESALYTMEIVDNLVKVN